MVPDLVLPIVRPIPVFGLVTIPRRVTIPLDHCYFFQRHCSSSTKANLRRLLRTDRPHIKSPSYLHLIGGVSLEHLLQKRRLPLRRQVSSRFSYLGCPGWRSAEEHEILVIGRRLRLEVRLESKCRCELDGEEIAVEGDGLGLDGDSVDGDGGVVTNDVYFVAFSFKVDADELAVNVDVDLGCAVEVLESLEHLIRWAIDSIHGGFLVSAALFKPRRTRYRRTLCGL